jgi:hypothetical protein
MFCSHINRISGHTLFDYVWFSVLRNLLFYEQHFELITAASAINPVCERLRQVGPMLLSETLDTIESSGLFTEKKNSGISSHSNNRPPPPPSRNNFWFATSCEMTKVISTPAAIQRGRELYPRFILPSV